jgi:hypothetical protein
MIGGPSSGPMYRGLAMARSSAACRAAALGQPDERGVPGDGDVAVGATVAEAVEDGAVVVGTLLGFDVRFDRMGLLLVDREW